MFTHAQTKLKNLKFALNKLKIVWNQPKIVREPTQIVFYQIIFMCISEYSHICNMLVTLPRYVPLLQFL